jgi:hypothetical protein
MNTNHQVIEVLFKKISEQGFDVNEPLKWGYYFIDKDKSKLEKIFIDLSLNGYQREELVEMEDGNWHLWLSKIDVLNQEKLSKRNKVFYSFQSYGLVNTYGGCHVL